MSLAAPKQPAASAIGYHRHEPERSALYRIVESTLPTFEAAVRSGHVSVPRFVEREFRDYLACGRLEHGFIRVKCDGCRHEHLVAFSCKRRGFCPSCGARRMVDTSAHLVDHVFPDVPVRQWVLSFPYPLRFLFASRPAGCCGRTVSLSDITAVRAHRAAWGSRTHQLRVPNTTLLHYDVVQPVD